VLDLERLSLYRLPKDRLNLGIDLDIDEDYDVNK